MTTAITPESALEEISQFAEDQLFLGAVKKGHPYREMVLATLAEDGSPDLRTVINRGVSRNPLVVRAYTDLRSTKVRQLQKNDRATLLFWHPRKRVQVKLHTRVVIHHKDAIAMEIWQVMGSGGRGSYLTAEAPGTPMEKALGAAAQVDPSIGAGNFVVLDCRLYQMEVLQLRSGGHVRAQFEYDGTSARGSFVVP